MSARCIGPKNGMWVEGKPRHSSGHRYIYADDVPARFRKMADARGLIPEPRLKAALRLGRPLKSTERVGRKTLRVFPSMSALKKWQQRGAR
jgi:hypothetical protein